MSSRSKKIVNMVLTKKLETQTQSNISQEQGPRINIISNIVLDKPPVDIIVPASSLDTINYGTSKEHVQHTSLLDAKPSNQYRQLEISNGYLDRPGPSHCSAELIEFESEDDQSMEPFEDSLSSYQPSEESDESDNEMGHTLLKRKSPLSKPAEEPIIKKSKPKQRNKKRNRKAKKETWQRTINKSLRIRGQKYISRSGKEIPDKNPKEVNCTRCRYKCHESIPEDQRQILCEEYYGLADYVRQKMYIASHMQNVAVVRKRNSPKTKNRKTSRSYFLENSNGIRNRVCLKFFCATLAISHRVTETCAENVSNTGLYTGYDRRRDTIPVNATSDETKQLVKTHIIAFPRIESHYCRRDSTKLYLSSDLNISIMYRMYKNEFCTEKDINPVSEFVYKKIFHEYEPRLAFYKPKKDQCFQCNAYKSTNDKIPLQEEYDSHKRRETEAMKMKEDDKKKSASEKGETFRSISFDLQAILSVPHAGDSQIYYRHKLNVYNFTIYDACNADGHCFVWDETHGNKGSTEIGSCLLKYLMSLPETVTHVASFSDTCSGQNRNKFVAAAMLFAVNNIEHLKTIDLKFMESGHSYLEADSMHATIERAKRHKKIYSTREWGLLISMARIKPRPYFVNNLQYKDFLNLQQLVADIIFNTTQNTQQEKVAWLNIKWLRFQEEKPFIVQYKYNLSYEAFLEINVSDKRKPGKKKTWGTVTLNQKYDSRLPVSQKKKKDLLYLLLNKIIPEDYTNFIEEIPATSNTTQLNQAKLDT